VSGELAAGLVALGLAVIASISGLVVKVARVLAIEMDLRIASGQRRLARMMLRRGLDAEPSSLADTAPMRRRKRRTFSERVILGSDRRRRTASDTTPDDE
jgi:hypothetical protein